MGSEKAARRYEGVKYEDNPLIGYCAECERLKDSKGEKPVGEQTDHNEELASANERTAQMAPHYRKGGAQQHWDRMWDLYREAWFVGNITKYVERYRTKNGLADLQKAKHYLQKLIELEEEEGRKSDGSGS
jgi:hypothetical protein